MGVGNELGMCGWCSVDVGKVVGGGIKEVSKADNSVALHTIDSYFLSARFGGEHFM